MAAPTIAPISVALEDFSGNGRVATPALLGAMLRAADKISDLIFSPGRPPQVQVYGQMISVQVPGLTALSADDTRHIAADLIGDNKQAITALREHGACDISFGLPGLARFRVNIFIQRGSCAVVMRVIPTDIPDFASLRLPQSLSDVTKLRDGIVLEAAETGHLVLSSLNTMDAPKTIERIVGSFGPTEQQVVRERLAKSFRYVICQRLIPKADRSGRVPAFEILKANARTRECIEKGDRENKTLLDAIKAGVSDGMQHFDGEIAQLVNDRVVDLETALSFASNPAGLGQELAR